MKIIDSRHFVSEKMKIIPISSDELNKYEFYKIINPSFNEIKDGMCIVVNENNSYYNKYLLYIVIAQDNLSNFFKNENSRISRYDNILIRYSYDTRSQFSYRALSVFKDKFPYHYKYNHIKIIDVYNTEIDTKKIDSIEKLKYEWDNVAKKIKNINFI